MSNEQLRRKR